MFDQPFFIPAILIMLLSLPLILGRIPRNRYYGIRTRRTLANDADWHRINRIGGGMGVFSSLIYLALAAAYPVAGPDDFQYWLLHLAVFALPLLASFLSVRFL